MNVFFTSPQTLTVRIEPFLRAWTYLPVFVGGVNQVCFAVFQRCRTLWTHSHLALLAVSTRQRLLGFALFKQMPSVSPSLSQGLLSCSLFLLYFESDAKDEEFQKETRTLTCQTIGLNLEVLDSLKVDKFLNQQFLQWP
jgi:hypothetical protein